MQWFFLSLSKMRMLWKSSDGHPICNQERLQEFFRVFAGTLHNLHTPKQSGFPICRKCATLLGKVIQRRVHDSASDPNADHTANKKETSTAYSWPGVLQDCKNVKWDRGNQQVLGTTGGSLSANWTFHRLIGLRSTKTVLENVFVDILCDMRTCPITHLQLQQIWRRESPYVHIKISPKLCEKIRNTNFAQLLHPQQHKSVVHLPYQQNSHCSPTPSPHIRFLSFLVEPGFRSKVATPTEVRNGFYQETSC